MIPAWLTLPVLRKLPWRLIGWAVAIFAAGLLAWRITVWRQGYQERKSAIAALADERKGRADDRTAFEQGLAQSQAQREALQADFAKIRGKFAAMTVPPPKDLTTSVEVPRGTSETCPVPRVSFDFVRVWNAQAAP